jgi:hypothetical protein
MNARIGILTFVWSRNYGAKLQAWALQSLISSLGYECEVINFKREHDSRYRFIMGLMRGGQFGRCVREILIDFLKWQKHSRLDAFTTQQMRLSTETCLSSDDLSRISGRYAAIVCGSDQVWNPDLTRASQSCYLLDFPARKEMMRISYAASIGKNFINESLVEYFSRCLKKFDAISVREKSAVDLVMSLAEKDVTTVLDPTLLLNQAQWSPLCADVDIAEPYLLVYSIGPEPQGIFSELIERVAQRRGLRIVTFHQRVHYQNEIRRFPNAGPREFLGLFSKAAFVVTNSFHGTAFSLIFKKPFFCIRLDNLNSRQRDLLNALDIGDRLIVDASTTDSQIDSEIDHAHVEMKLQALRVSSITFLDNALQKTKIRSS